MKAFSLWLFKLCWRREIETVRRNSQPKPAIFGPDYADGFESGADYTLETLHLKEPK